MPIRHVVVAAAIALIGACTSTVTANTTTVADTASATATTAAPSTTIPTFAVEGVLPDGQAFVVSGLDHPEQLHSISVGISVRIGPTQPVVGITSIWRTTERYESPTWLGDRLLLRMDGWLVQIHFYDHVLEALGPDAREVTEQGIRAYSVNGMAALDLDLPFFFTENRESPLHIEVLYETFAVGRGCDPSHEVLCSDDGLLHAVPRPLPGGNPQPLPPAFAIESTYTGDQVRFLVLGVSTEDRSELGKIDHALTIEDLSRFWHDYGFDGDPPPIDLERYVILFYNRAEDACPDYLLRLYLNGDRLIPKFAAPWEGICEQPLIPTSYAVSIDRTTLPLRFTAYLPPYPPASGSEYPEIEYLVDLTSGG